MQKKPKFQVGSTSLLRPCQDVTAPNTSQLRFVAHLITHAPRSLRFYYILPKTFQIALRANCAFATISPCSSRSYKFKSTLSTFSVVLQVFWNELWFQKIAREDIKAGKRVALHNLAPVFMLVLSVW